MKQSEKRRLRREREKDAASVLLGWACEVLAEKCFVKVRHSTVNRIALKMQVAVLDVMLREVEKLRGE
ncbi:MAG: hypothetical protein A4E20_08900 [Nitrospira sp. SG-bin2]|uniref:hypothetical protein n=1 Tax=Nitrospira cf. moscoviensis SBR1015 TaxID=96242 RepID=UPI000A09C8FA|nr:hypothetical protein [Nitrospira cf. moscoviensis SBR1015]OQW35849.1 MAG: hypothetical protein A4E20_08900 [Nitrospira sp. SG-bin2]